MAAAFGFDVKRHSRRSVMSLLNVLASSRVRHDARRATHGVGVTAWLRMPAAALLTIVAGFQLSGFTGGVAWAEQDPNSRYTVYVASKDDDTLSVIDAATNTVIDAIPVDDGPVHVAYS